MIADNDKNRPDRLALVPREVRERICSDVPPDQIKAFSPYDLSAHGAYTTGYLVLADGRLGHYSNGDGNWRCEWLPVDRLDGAKIVEGLGMSVLRVTAAGAVLSEYRFTNRHAKTMAELHVHLERHVEKSETPPEDSGGEGGPPDKKTHCEKCGGAIPDWAETCPNCLQQRKVLMRLAQFVRPHIWLAISGLSLSVLILGMNLLRPIISEYIIDDAIRGGRLSLLLWLVGAFGAILAGEAVFGAARQWMMSRLGMRTAAEIRDRCYAHMHRLSLAYFSRKSTGSLITRVTSDSDRIWDFVAFHLVNSIMAVLTFVGVGAVMFWRSWQLALLVMIPIPAMIVLMTVFHRKMHGTFVRMWHRWSAMTAVVADAIPGMRVIKAFNQEKREVQRFHDRNYAVYDSEQEMITTLTVFGPAMLLASQVAFLIIWGIGGWWAIRDLGLPEAERAMTVGKLVAFQGLMWMFFQPIHQIAHMSRMFNRAATSVQRIFEVLDTEPEIYTKRGAKRLQDLKGHIVFRNVSFSYDGVRRVLKNISFEVHPGEMVGLVGHSGSGKSTLINLLCRFYDPLEGQIFVDGTDIRDYDMDDLRKFIGVVLQEPYLFRGTIAENVAYGRPGAGILDVIRAARAANVHDAIVGFPDGYDTLVGERGHTLSGGERQRVSIARAILNDPRLLVLDEATSNVDTKTEKQIQQALDHLVAERTTFAIAHRLSTLQRADRLIVLDKGTIVEQGTHAELESKPEGVYAGLLKMQMEMKSTVALAE